MNKVNYEYNSIFKDDINNLLKDKKFVLSPTTLFGYSSVLKNFDLWCIENNIVNNNLDLETINNWILSGCKTKSHKVTVIRELAKSINKYGGNAYIIPKKYYKSNDYHIPYIFSDKEILSFIKYLDDIKPVYGYIYRRETFALIFKLLIFTGSRKSDILNLKIKDVDIKNNLIYIHNGKNDIDRILPIDSELMEQLNDYKKLIGNYDNDDDYFFCDIHKKKNSRTKISDTTLFTIFRKGLETINTPYKNIHEGPRIHDFRFTFIVKSIQKLINENKDLNVYLPILSKYVGHTTFNDTLYYFKPKELIFSKDNYQFNSLIPKLNEGEFDEE